MSARQIYFLLLWSFCGLFITVWVSYSDLTRDVIGYWFLFATLIVYALAGFYLRTTHLDGYYLGDRRFSSFQNGIATAADWISAASFIGLVGQLYLSGIDGLAYLIGWSGGFCLLAFWVWPYLRQSGLYTLPEFLAHRYPRPLAINGKQKYPSIRLCAALAAIVICFIYVIAQIYAVGLIVSRLTGINFAIGVFLALAGILVCSFLGGMRAITWTQILQYFIFSLALLILTFSLAHKQSNNAAIGLSYQAIFQITQNYEKKSLDSSAEKNIRLQYAQAAQKVKDKIRRLPTSWVEERQRLVFQLDRLKANNANYQQLRLIEQSLRLFPKTPENARQQWLKELQKLERQASEPLSLATGQPEKRITADFVALIFCLMLGTATLPHILSRGSTVKSTKAARRSIFWTLFFILLFYLPLPLLTLLIHSTVSQELIGSAFERLPDWVLYWSQLDRGESPFQLLDINGDGKVQGSEIYFSSDLLMLLTPEIAGLPIFVSAIVTAGALAAALSTADGLLLSIATIFSHDIYYRHIDKNSSPRKRVTVAKSILLTSAMLAAYIATLKIGNIVLLVEIAFSLSASILFPSIILSVLWRRANYWGALSAMLMGLLTVIFYFYLTYPGFSGSPQAGLWGIGHTASGLFGAIAGLITHLLVSRLTTPDPRVDQFITKLRQA